MYVKTFIRKITRKLSVGCWLFCCLTLRSTYNNNNNKIRPAKTNSYQFAQLHTSSLGLYEFNMLSLLYAVKLIALHGCGGRGVRIHTQYTYISL